jgi:hypothetical protein
MALPAFERALDMVDATGHGTARRAASILLPATTRSPASLLFRRSYLFLCCPDYPAGCQPGRETMQGEIKR